MKTRSTKRGKINWNRAVLSLYMRIFRKKWNNDEDAEFRLGQVVMEQSWISTN
jgi:hypothetical protein